MRTLTVQRLLTARPTDIPADWLIFNAPRPLYGDETWQGDFMHGIFYAAVNPAGEYAPNNIRGNVENDGWLCEYITRQDVSEWAKDFAAANDFDLSCYGDKEINQSYYANGNGRVEIAVSSPQEVIVYAGNM